MSKKCVVSFANQNNRYLKNLSRLGESLSNFGRPNFDGDFLGFVGEASCGAPKHEENPYAFKIYCIQKAIDAGYTQILWLDSSCFAIKNIQPIFDEIERNGMIFQEAGHCLEKWCNDETLKYFDISREAAMSMPMIGNAGFLGLNMSNVGATVFFNEWKKAMEAGMFKGSWEDHRHDMSCSSAIINKMGLIGKAKKRDEWLQYAGLYDKPLNDTILIKAQG